MGPVSGTSDGAGHALVRIKMPEEFVECPDCGELWCEEHQAHYFECGCPGVFSEEEDGWAPAFEGPDGHLYTYRVSDG